MQKNCSLFILIAGPYRSNTGDDAAKIEEVFRLGHLPILGESLALPLIGEAGSERVGDAIFNEIFHPISRMLAERVDAVLRVGGASKGADEMVNIARRTGKRVFKTSDIPPIDASSSREPK